MKALWLALLLCLSAPSWPQTMATWNGIPVGSATGNISAINGNAAGTWNSLQYQSAGGGVFGTHSGGGSTIVMDGSGCVNGNASGTTASCTLTVPTAGDLITVMTAARNSGSFTVTDSNGQTYPSIYSAFDPSNPVYSGMLYAKNSVAGTMTVTITIPTSGGTVGLYAQAWKGASTTSPLDSTFSSSFYQAQTGSVANANCGTVRTPSAANELILSSGVFDTVTPSAGANYTFANTTDFLYTQYWIQTSATSTNGAFVSAPDDWIAGCAAFHS
jgi:hypothetical protein